MSKFLVSWVAFTHDFKSKQLPSGKFRTESFNINGPNGGIHSNVLDDYKTHYWMMSWEEGSGPDMEKMPLIREYLKEHELEEKVEVEYWPIKDVIDINEINNQTERVIESITKKNGITDATQIEVFISPGTPTMQTAWYFLQRIVPIRLFQVRPREFRDNDVDDIRSYLNLERITATSGRHEQQIAHEAREEDYLISPAIEPVYKRALKIAQNKDVPSFINGDTGTGKEHLARYIHLNSARKDKPFIPVNCAALDDQLLESRLFGYVAGAFTGAAKDSKGLFEIAKGGTIFLDEIGDISPKLQQSLLRVLEEKKISPVGSFQQKQVDVRVITATHHDLIDMCKKGKFRWDLYYRLVVTDVKLPSLMKRGPKEIKLYIDHFLYTKMQKFDRTRPLKLSKEVREALNRYPFPGNIRELENLIARFHVFCEKDEVELMDLPARILKPDRDISWKSDEVMIAHVKKALDFFDWNISRVTKELGLGSTNTVKKWIRVGGLTAP